MAVAVVAEVTTKAMVVAIAVVAVDIAVVLVDLVAVDIAADLAEAVTVVLAVADTVVDRLMAAVVLLVKEALHLQNVLQAADTAVQTKVDQVATAIATTHVGVELAVATKNQAINSVNIKK